MKGALHYTATFTSWLTDRSLAPTTGATPSAFAPGVAPCAAKTPHTLRLALRFLSLRGFFVGYRLNLRRWLRFAPHLPLALRVPSATLRVHSSSSGSLFWSLPLRFRGRCVSPRGWLRYRYASPRAERSRAGARSWALPIPAIIGRKVTGWRPFMGSAHTRHNRRKRHGLAMLATFMGSAHTRHNRRKGHGLAPVHGLCPYPPYAPVRSRAGARSWALPIPAICSGEVTGWRPFMGAAHTRHNRRKRHGLAMLATFMGSAHTRHNRRKGHIQTAGVNLFFFLFLFPFCRSLRFAPRPPKRVGGGRSARCLSPAAPPGFPLSAPLRSAAPRSLRSLRPGARPPIGRSAGFAGARAARTPLCSAAGRVPAGRLPLVAARRTPAQLLRYSAARQVPAGRLPLVAARRTPVWLLRLLRVSGTRTLPLVAIGYPTHSAQATPATVCYPDRPERSPRTVCFASRRDRLARSVSRPFHQGHVTTKATQMVCPGYATLRWHRPFGTPCRLSSVRGHYVALMKGALHYTATFTSWLTDRSLAPCYGGDALCIRSGRRPLRGQNSAYAPFGLAVLVAPRGFCRLRSAPSGYFFKPSVGDYAPTRLTAGFAPLRVKPAVCVRLLAGVFAFSGLVLAAARFHPFVVRSVVPCRASLLLCGGLDTAPCRRMATHAPVARGPPPRCSPRVGPPPLPSFPASRWP